MTRAIDLQILAEIDLGQRLGQCRAAPVTLGPEAPPHAIVVYAADFDVDPYEEMFFFPTDTPKLALLDLSAGKVVWRRDLGRAHVPGMWFLPVLPADIDGDGADEIYFCQNLEPQHPMSRKTAVGRLDATTGEPTGQFDWPRLPRTQTMGQSYRRFLITGRGPSGQQVLVAANGTYADMSLRGFIAEGSDLRQIWQCNIAANDPGARGSHMCPVADLDGDGIDELLWGERIIRMDTGEQVRCFDEGVYRGHSDVIQPFRDPADSSRWRVFTIRESDPQASPRVVTFDAATGDRVWGDVEAGHMDMGWTARLERGWTARAIRIGSKTCGPDGRFHQDMDEFVFDAASGERVDLGFSTYRTLPVDLNGDGRHELVAGSASGGGQVLDAGGRPVGDVSGSTAMLCKFLPERPGEQLLTYHDDGRLRVWADVNAEDNDEARRRYADPFYAANMKLSSTGSNLVVLGGI